MPRKNIRTSPNAVSAACESPSSATVIVGRFPSFIGWLWIVIGTTGTILVAWDCVSVVQQDTFYASASYRNHPVPTAVLAHANNIHIVYDLVFLCSTISFAIGGLSCLKCKVWGKYVVAVALLMYFCCSPMRLSCAGVGPDSDSVHVVLAAIIVAGSAISLACRDQLEDIEQLENNEPDIVLHNDSGCAVAIASEWKRSAGRRRDVSKPRPWLMRGLAVGHLAWGLLLVLLAAYATRLAFFDLFTGTVWMHLRLALRLAVPCALLGAWMLILCGRLWSLRRPIRTAILVTHGSLLAFGVLNIVLGIYAARVSELDHSMASTLLGMGGCIDLAIGTCLVAVALPSLVLGLMAADSSDA